MIEEEMIYLLFLTCLSLCRLEPASWFPVTFTKMCIPSFSISDVKSGPIANLLIVIHCSIQKDFFIYVYACSGFISYLNKPFQGLKWTEMVSELVSEQENINASKLWSQQGHPAMHLIHFITLLTSLQDQ